MTVSGIVFVCISSYPTHLIDFSCMASTWCQQGCFCFAFHLVKPKNYKWYLSVCVRFSLPHSEIDAIESGVGCVAWAMALSILHVCFRESVLKALLNLFRLSKVYSMPYHRHSTDNNNSQQKRQPGCSVHTKSHCSLVYFFCVCEQNPQMRRVWAKNRTQKNELILPEEQSGLNKLAKSETREKQQQKLTELTDCLCSANGIPYCGWLYCTPKIPMFSFSQMLCMANI